MAFDIDLVSYKNSGDLLRDAREIIETSRDSAYQAVNLALVRIVIRAIFF